MAKRADRTEYTKLRQRLKRKANKLRKQGINIDISKYKTKKQLEKEGITGSRLTSYTKQIKKALKTDLLQFEIKEPKTRRYKPNFETNFEQEVILKILKNNIAYYTHHDIGLYGEWIGLINSIASKIGYGGLADVIDEMADRGISFGYEEGYSVSAFLSYIKELKNIIVERYGEEALPDDIVDRFDRMVTHYDSNDFADYEKTF